MYPLCPATHDLGLSRLFDLATILMALDCRPGDRVLDVGAGSGFSSEMLARLGYEVIAFDPSLGPLDNNRRRPSYDPDRIEGTVRVVAAVAEHLPFAAGSFDGAVGMHVLHHLDDLPTALADLSRVLRPGARAVFCEPGLDHMLGAETQRAITEHGENDKPFDVLEFIRVALALGFSDAYLPATVRSPLNLVPFGELELYRSGRHPRPEFSPAGIIEELHRQRPYAVLVRAGVRPRTSRRPGTLHGELTVVGARDSAAIGETLELRVSARNTGDTPWLSTPSRFGGFVTIGCKLLAANGRLVDDVLGRTYLNADVAPGDSIDTAVRVRIPDSIAPGRYVLAIDLIDELMCWFSDLDPAVASRHALDITAT